MKFAAFASISLIVTLVITAASGQTEPRLAGIVNLPGYKRALLQDSKFPRWHLLGEGERDGDIEVKSISPADFAVTFNLRTNQDFKLAMEATTNQSADGQPTIVLENAPFGSAVEIYQIFCQATVLQHPRTPAPQFTFRSSATNRTDATRDLQKAFADKGIVVVRDGEKFVMLGPQSVAQTLIPREPQTNPAETNASSQSAGAQTHPQEVLPAGTIDFRNADFNQVFDLYGMLIDHQVDRTHPFRGPVQGGFWLHTQTPLSRTEAIYAVSTLINWRGVNVVTQSDGLIIAMPSSR